MTHLHAHGRKSFARNCSCKEISATDVHRLSVLHVRGTTFMKTVRASRTRCDVEVGMTDSSVTTMVPPSNTKIMSCGGTCSKWSLSKYETYLLLCPFSTYWLLLQASLGATKRLCILMGYPRLPDPVYPRIERRAR